MGSKTTFFAQASATATRATAVFTTAVEFSNTPPDNSTIVYIASTEIHASTASTPYEARLIDNTNASVYSNHCHVQTQLNSADPFIMNGFGLISYGAAPGAQSISLEVRACAAGTNLQRSNSYIYGLVLGENDSHSFDAAVVAASATDFKSAGSALSVSVASSGKYLILAYAEASCALQGTSAMSTKFRMVLDGSAQPPITTPPTFLTALPRAFVYAGYESWAAGAHTVEMQAAAARPGAGGSSVYNVSLVAIELSAFPNAYVTADTIPTSGSSLAFATVKSFTETLAVSGAYTILSYYAPSVEGSAAAFTVQRHKYLLNGEDMSETSNRAATAPGSVAGHISSPFIMAVNATLAAQAHNISLQSQLDAASSDYDVDRTFVAFLQLAPDAGGEGGNSTTPKTITAIGHAIPSITKQVGKRLDARTTSIASIQRGFFQSLQAVTRSIAALGVSSAFRVTLNALTRSVATMNVATIRDIYLAAVTNSVAQFTKRVGKNLHAVAGSLANFTKSVGKPLQAVTNSPATLAAQTVIVVPMEAVGEGVASMTEVYVTASTGTAPGSVPYVLHLGDSVKRFTSLIAYQFGIGKGTVSDRDPDT